MRVINKKKVLTFLVPPVWPVWPGPYNRYGWYGLGHATGMAGMPIAVPLFWNTVIMYCENLQETYLTCLEMFAKIQVMPHPKFFNSTVMHGEAHALYVNCYFME